MQVLHEQLDSGRVKGSIIRAHLEWVRDHARPDEVGGFFEDVSRVMGQQFSTVLASSWYRFADLIEVDRLILQRFGNGNPHFLEELGAYSARMNLRALDGLLKPADIHDFFRRAALMHRQFQDFGTAKYEAEQSHGRAIQADYVAWSPLYCATARGFYAECVRLHGLGGVKVFESECHCAGQRRCVFEISWR